jgi:hypothetical protein
MTLLTRREVQAMTRDKAARSLKDLERIYDQDRSFVQDPEYFKRIWPSIDDIANTICYLQDHIQRIDTRIAQQTSNGRTPEEIETRFLAELETDSVAE